MSDGKDMNETTQRINRLKEVLERQKRNKPGTFELYNYEILKCLRYKFPEEDIVRLLGASLIFLL